MKGMSEITEIMECYVDYHDCKNNYKPSKKFFKTWDDAWEWIVKTFDTPSKDFIKYI